MTRPSIDDFPVGRAETLEVTIGEAEIDRFAALSGDDNPVHMDEAAARAAGFPRRVAHGVLSLSFLSTVIGTRLPGPGALWRSLQVDWLRPVFPGDRLKLVVTVVQASRAAESLVLDVAGFTPTTQVLRGRAVVGLLANAEPDARSVAPAHAAAPATSTPPAPLAASGRSNRPVLVTGGSRGIGRAATLELARRGHPVAVGFHRGSRDADAVVAEIAAAGGRAIPIALDAASTGTLAPAVETAARALGPVLAIVHAASPPIEVVPAAEASIESLETYFRVYVAGALALAQAALPTMRAAGWGRLVFIGTSYLMGAPPPKMIGYVAAKGGLLSLARALAVELGPHGVTTNVVSPSLTITDLARDASPRMQLAEAQRNPMRRLATPEDSAHVIAQLLGDEASFINGAHLPVTGGSAFP